MKNTASEAHVNAHQFYGIFGVIDGVSRFRLVIDRFIHEEKLQAGFAYLDNNRLWDFREKS